MKTQKRRQEPAGARIGYSMFAESGGKCKEGQAVKGFFRGVLALAMIVSLAFNGAMYCALQERSAAQRQTLDERDGALERARQAEQELHRQAESAAQAQAQLSLVQETLEKREAQLGEMNVSLGQAVESGQALREALSDRQAEIETLRAQADEAAHDRAALQRAQEEKEAFAQSAEALREEKESLSAQLGELQEQLAQSSFGQEDRVQAIADLQRQLAERGELLKRAQEEYERLEEQLTWAEETNAGQAVLIQESGERERLAQARAQELREQLDALEAQLTQAEENYGGAAVTLTEQAAELEAARQRVEALEERLAQGEEPILFTGREIGLSFALPEGMLAAEYQGAVYLSCGEAQGVLREIPMPGDAGQFDLEQALEQVLGELYEQGERPPVTVIENGYRFTGPENGAQCSEMCVLRQGDSLFCLKLEGGDASRLTEMMQALYTEIQR